MERSQKSRIITDLDKKMVFLVGPRQCGKTWLAREISKDFKRSEYLNYDSFEDRKVMLEQGWFDDTELLVLDEIHKMPNWKNYLKGLYDTKPDKLKILVTGSARLEVFKQVGDSLAGRFFLHHLMPFSPSELLEIGAKIDMNKLQVRGGFPEPYLAVNNTEAERWRMQYADSLVRTDVLDFQNIHDVRAIQLVFDLLRRRVGSPISYSSIAQDVGIAPNTVKKYIEILEALFVVFRVTPYSTNIARSLLKEPKLYFYDTGLVKGDKGICFENLVAVSLLKHMFFRRDYKAEDVSLHYLRTKDQLEVDFLLAKDNLAESMIEVKWKDESLSKSLKFFHEKYQISAIQLCRELKRQRKSQGVEFRRGQDFLEGL